MREKNFGSQLHCFTWKLSSLKLSHYNFKKNELNAYFGKCYQSFLQLFPEYLQIFQNISSLIKYLVRKRTLFWMKILAL